MESSSTIPTPFKNERKENAVSTSTDFSSIFDDDKFLSTTNEFSGKYKYYRFYIFKYLSFSSQIIFILLFIELIKIIISDAFVIFHYLFFVLIFILIFIFIFLLSNLFVIVVADGPPMTSTGSLLEVEEEEEEEGEGEEVAEGEGEGGGGGEGGDADDIDEDRELPIKNLIENDTTDEYIKANLQRIAALSAETKTVNSASDSYAYGKDVEINAKVDVKVEAGVSAIVGGGGEGGVVVGEGEDAQDTFTKLLKATMDQQSAAAESSIGNITKLYLFLHSYLNSF